MCGRLCFALRWLACEPALRWLGASLRAISPRRDDIVVSPRPSRRASSHLASGRGASGRSVYSAQSAGQRARPDQRPTRRPRRRSWRRDERCRPCGWGASARPAPRQPEPNWRMRVLQQSHSPTQLEFSQLDAGRDQTQTQAAPDLAGDAPRGALRPHPVPSRLICVLHHTDSPPGHRVSGAPPRAGRVSPGQRVSHRTLRIGFTPSACRRSWRRAELGTPRARHGFSARPVLATTGAELENASAVALAFSNSTRDLSGRRRTWLHSGQISGIRTVEIASQHTMMTAPSRQ